jgi:ElaB/YqjD/DUF883 family membrane-anchored ribosome-binding protein
MANTTGTRQNVTETAADKAKEMAGNVKDKAKEMASTIGEKARDTASAVGDKAESTISSVGSGMQSVADTIRDKGPHQGMMGSATSAVASALDTGGRYLEDQGLSGMADDLTNLIRRNPLPALLLGVGFGFLLARMTTRS